MSDLSMLIPIEIDPFTFAEHLVRNATYEEILDVIICLDEAMMDWDFTEMVANHFAQQMANAKEEGR